MEYLFRRPLFRAAPPFSNQKRDSSGGPGSDVTEDESERMTALIAQMRSTATLDQYEDIENIFKRCVALMVGRIGSKY